MAMVVAASPGGCKLLSRHSADDKYMTALDRGRKPVRVRIRPRVGVPPNNATHCHTDHSQHLMIEEFCRIYICVGIKGKSLNKEESDQEDKEQTHCRREREAMVLS